MRALVVLAALGLGSCQQLSADEQMQQIKDKVAEDAVKQYDMVVASGSAIDRCVQAGMVAAAYLQAQRQNEYAKWKTIENGACAAAGVQR